VVTKQGVWMLVAWALAMPVLADEMTFQGHVLDVDAAQSPAVVRAITSSRYVVAGDAATLATKARTCLATQPGVSAVTTVDATRVEGDLSIQQGGFFSSLRANTRIAIEVNDGAFHILESGLTQQAAGADASQAAVPAPDAGGAKLLDAVFTAEQGVVDCLYR
jgi:hypothetical protein